MLVTGKQHAPRLFAALLLTSAAYADEQTSDPDAATPHPIITEVLFHVPPGDSADANRDGERHATGDEFIELFNPTAQPINLAGYTLTNRLATDDPTTSRGVRFTFPEFTLEPGHIVVVFNGFGADIAGSIGTGEAAPTAPNDLFHDAFVFVINPRSQNNALANNADFLLLSAPDGTPLEAVSWGDPDPAPSEDTRTIHEVQRNPRGSVQRTAPDQPFLAHRSIDKQPFSPGRLPNHPGIADAEDKNAPPDSSPPDR